jgi:DNA-binding MarR family transcriptional regulator
MSDLADRMQLTRGAVTQLVTYLEEHGLLKRVPDPEDGRGVVVKPTRAAHRGYESGRRHIAELEEQWMKRVGTRRWAMFRPFSKSWQIFTTSPPSRNRPSTLRFQGLWPSP